MNYPKKYGIPLHPKFNLFWHDINFEELSTLSEFIQKNGCYQNSKLILPGDDKKIREILIKLGATFYSRENMIIIEKYGYPLIRCCGLDEKLTKVRTSSTSSKKDIMAVVSELAGVKIKKACTHPNWRTNG